jgi:hypothetical protein
MSIDPERIVDVALLFLPIKMIKYHHFSSFLSALSLEDWPFLVHLLFYADGGKI